MIFTILFTWVITLAIGIYISFELNRESQNEVKLYALFSSDHRLRGVFNEKEMKKTLLNMIHQELEEMKNMPIDELSLLLEEGYIEALKLNKMK